MTPVRIRRNEGQAVVIGPVTVQVSQTRDGKVLLEITAPRDYPIVRAEQVERREAER